MTDASNQFKYRAATAWICQARNIEVKPLNGRELTEYPLA